MKIIYITTQDIFIAKDMLVKAAIRTGMSYVEMENEVIIEYDCLFRIILSNNKLHDDFNLIDISTLENFDSHDYYIDYENIPFNYQSDIPMATKNDYKRLSRKVNNMVKTKQQYIRRRYR